MIDEPIPDEFGSWARLLPTPEEKQPAAEKPAAAKVPAIQAAEEQFVIESTAAETATLAHATDETLADDEPLFARAIEPEASEGMVALPKAANEVVADLKPPIAVAHKVESEAAPEPAVTGKAPADDVLEGKAPIEAVADKAEPKASDKPVAVKKAAEEKPAGEKTGSHPAIDEKVKRPFRVKLRGSLLVLVRLPNKRTIQGSFHQLSISGGVIHFEKPLDEKLEVELIFHLKETTIRSKAQMLFPMWATQGWMQPFRFVGLADDNRRVLDQGLKLFVGDLANGASAGA